MFTKIKINFLMLLAGLVVFPQFVGASSLDPLTSGMKYTYYSVEWCPTQKTISTSCVDAFFTQQGTTGYLSYTGGVNYQTNDATKVKLNPNFTSTKTTSKSVIDIFSGISNIKFQGEGKYTFKIVLVDYANNASVQDLVYLVDKTAPQFEILSTTDANNFVYSGERVDGVFQNVMKYDSNIQISNSDDRYDIPDVNSYSGDTAQLRNTHVRSKLHTIYFRDIDTNHKFRLNLKFSENYDGNLNNFAAGEKNFTLLDDSNNVLNSGIALGTSIELNTSYFAIPEDSQKKYKLRLYDKTVGKGGVNDSNYSEVAFYVVRDNTAPNLTPFTKNILAAQTAAMKKILQFSDNTSVWDETTTGFDIKTAGKSFARFIAANSSQNLISEINDIGISSTDPEKYNAGVATGVAIKIDTAANNSIKSDVITYTDRFNNNISRNKDFSLVDNFIDPSKGYRYYSTEFKNTNLDGICDLVGNCLKPELQFRVVADEMSTTTSNTTLASTYKAIADGTTPYTFTTQIKDQYGNIVRSIQSAENSNLVLKTLSSEFEFNNNVFLDQVDETGNKGLVVADNESDNASKLLSGINTTNKISFTEDFAKNGQFSFKLGSVAPTSGAYPYTSGIEAGIKNINTKVIDGGNSDVKFGNVGAFDNNTGISGTTKLVNINKDVFVNEKTKDIDSTKKSFYGDVSVTSSNNNFAALTAKKVNFEFTPAYLYSSDLELAPLYAFNTFVTHNKTLSKITNQNTVSFTNVNENFLSKYNNGNKDDASAVKFYYDGSTSDVRDLPRSLTLGVNPAKIKATPGLPSYNPNIKIALGYASKINYLVNGENITLPSISRNVSNNFTLTQQNQSSDDYFDSNYKIIDDGVSVLGGQFQIAVTGLSNKNDTLLSNTQLGKSNVTIGGELTRYELLKTVKSNIANLSKGVNFCNGYKNITDDLSACTVKNNGEDLVFIKGNLTINADYSVTTKKTFVVEDGNIFINGNISNNNTGLLTLVTVTKNGLTNVSVDKNIPDVTNKKAWIYISPTVTNIDASLISEGPVVSYDGNKLFGVDVEAEELRNQLHIYGSVLSLNTIGGTKENDTLSKCPYIVSNCSRENAAIFDLVYLRRFTLLNEGTQVYAYHPTGKTTAKRSGGKTGPFDLISLDTGSTLRIINDPDFKKFPLFIEKDTKTSTSPSVIFRIDR